MELDLLIDIGNTRSKWIATKAVIEQAFTIEFSGAINNQVLSDKIQEQFAFLSTPDSTIEIKRIYCTCVGKSDYLKIWQAQFPKASLYQLLGDTTITDFENGYQHPKELGTDRLAGMLGSKQLYPQKNTLIISSGTATTIDYLHQGSRFLGGWIIPGFDLMLQSLGKSTANLPTLQANGLTTEVAEVLATNNLERLPIEFGTSTKDAIEMGVILATIGAIKQAIKQFNHLELVVITGGNANLIETYLLSDLHGLPLFQEPNLILIGVNAWRTEHRKTKL